MTATLEGSSEELVEDSLGGLVVNETAGIRKTDDVVENIGIERTFQKISMKRIGIPCVFGLDQNHGSTYTQGGTLFPQNINVAATFNREIARRSAEATLSSINTDKTKVSELDPNAQLTTALLQTYGLHLKPEPRYQQT